MAIPVSPYDAMVQRRVAPLMPQPVAPAMPQMSSGAPEDYMAQAAAMRAQAMAGAQQGIDPRIAAILQQREARLAEQETALGTEEKRSPWEALMRAGAAMAGSQSRTFGGGLAEGVNAGLGALNRSRAEGLRQRDLIAQGRESLGMERISQEGAGRRAAMSDFESQVSLADKLAGQAKAQAEARLAIAKSIPDPVMRRLEVMKAEREIAKLDSEIFENRASGMRSLRPEAAGGGAGGVSVEQRQDRSELDRAAVNYNIAARNYRLAKDSAEPDPEKVREATEKFEAEIQRLSLLNRIYANRYGSSNYGVGISPSQFSGKTPPPVRPAPASSAASNDPLGLRR